LILQKADQSGNVTATPHIAGSSRETVVRGAIMMAEEIKRFLEEEAASLQNKIGQGKPAPKRVNRWHTIWESIIGTSHEIKVAILQSQIEVSGA
jgi:hypothetical protein